MCCSHVTHSYFIKGRLWMRSNDIKRIGWMSQLQLQSQFSNETLSAIMSRWAFFFFLFENVTNFEPNQTRDEEDSCVLHLDPLYISLILFANLFIHTQTKWRTWPKIWEWNRNNGNNFILIVVTRRQFFPVLLFFLYVCFVCFAFDVSHILNLFIVSRQK